MIFYPFSKVFENSKTFAGLSLANEFKVFLLKKIFTSPFQLARIVALGFAINDIFDEELETRDKIIKVLNLIGKFKDEHPEEFALILEAIREFLDTYEKEPKLIAQKLENLLS